MSGIVPVHRTSDPMYVTIKGDEGLENFNQSIANSTSHASSTSYNYTRQEGSTYNRLGYGYGDYEDQRPCEKIPTRHHDIMRESERLYEQIGLVKNMIDLMTDFTVQGIRVVHPSPHIEKVFRRWFKKVDGLDRSERFCASLYKYGNVIVRRRWAKVNKGERDKLRKARANDVPLHEVQGQRGRIPSRYVFLNPSTVQVIGGDVANFIGKPSLRYGIRVPMSLQMKIAENDPVIKEMIAQLPEELKNGKSMMDGTDQVIPLDPDNLVVDHYKKDDWQLWAKPIMYGVFKDLRVLEKLKLADLTALDGAVDRVRIFKLGSLEEQLMPTQAAFSKLNELLRVNAGAGTRNIVWGPDITMEESKSDVSAFLGEDKYRPTMSSIYGGLGIPPSLTGTNEVGGTTNNLVSLKALIKRLDYVRNKLIEFWMNEFQLVIQGLKMSSELPSLEFDQNNLGDEEAEKRLFIDLADRDIIPYEVVHNKFGLDTQSTSSKVEREWKQRDKDKRVEKAGPFHRTQFDDEVKKSLINRGKVTPSEVGVELEPRDPPDDTTNLDEPAQETTTQPEQEEPKNVDRGGRPPNSRDKQPRKKRRFVPVVKAAEIWANEAQAKIADIVNPVILAQMNKKNMRSLTLEETNRSEAMKFGILFNTKPFSEITEDVVLQSLSKKFPQDEFDKAVGYISEVEGNLGRPLVFAEKHNIYSEMYLDKV